jgi:hypothetical protein
VFRRLWQLVDSAREASQGDSVRKLIAVIGTAGLLIVCSTARGTITAAQTRSGFIQNSNQLALPASAFPTGYQGDAGEVWLAPKADGSSFSQMHVKSYTAMGMQGAWYEYFAKVILVFSSSGAVAGPAEAVYLGTYYQDALSAANAYSDVLSNPALSNPMPCSYGTRCVTYAVNLTFSNGVTYDGLARIVQQGNAVAEIRVDTPDVLSGQISTGTFTANLDGVSQAFVQTVGGAPVTAPTDTPTVPAATSTSTPIPQTATPTSTRIPPTATPTSTPTATPTSTPIPLSLAVKLGHKVVAAGAKQSISVTTLPGANVSVVVTFPDGAKKRHSGTADENGAYTWSFKQPAGHDTASKHTAKVVVTVSHGTDTPLKTTKSYTIKPA